MHEARAEAEHPTDLYPQILARSIRALGTEFGVPVDDSEADALAVSVPDWPAFPDSARALQRLAQRYKLIILSNVDRQSFAGSTERLGVNFTSILTAQDIGSYKPSQANFDALETEIARLGIGKDKLLHVAQTCFTTTCPPSTPDCPPCGSTVATTTPAGVPRRHHPPM